MSEINDWLPTAAGNAIAFDDIDGRDGRPREQGKLNGRAQMAAIRRAFDNLTALSVKSYGATGDGVTDDSAAIRLAIAACSERRDLRFPIGTYVVKQDGLNPWCLNKPASMRFVGETMGGSVIFPHTSVPDTCDIVREYPSAIYANRGGGCSHIAIESPVNGTRAGRDGWRVDTTATLAPDAQINSNLYESLSTGSPTAAIPGYGFRHINNAANIQGGMYTSTIRESRLAGGFCFTKTGDSISVLDCRTSGPLPNVIDQIVNVAGSANTFSVERCNVTNAGGLFQVTNAPGLLVTRINGESFAAGAATTNGAAAIWLRLPAPFDVAATYDTGDLSVSIGIIYRALRATVADTPASSPLDWAAYDPFENATFTDNLLSVAGGAGGFDGNTVVRLDAGQRVKFRSNRMGIGAASVKGFIVGAGAKKADLRGNTWPEGFAEADKLTSSGVDTVIDTSGTVTQATNKGTVVTLDRMSGTITMNGAALAATTGVGFQLTNALIAAGDVVLASIKSGATADAYTLTVDSVAVGSCRISLRNVSAGALSEAVVLNFVVMKGTGA